MSIIFLHKNLDTTSYSSIALTNSEALATGYPLTNLQDQYKTTYAKSNTTAGDQTFKFDLGATYACDSALFMTHNFTSVAADAGIKLQYADDSGYSTNLTTADADITTADGVISYTTFNSATKRYWRLLFDMTAGSLSAAPYIGQIFLGTKFTHAYGYSIGNTEETGYEVLKQRSWDGTDSAYLQYTTKRRYWGSVRFQIITSSYKTNFDTWFESVKGGYRPFMMSTDSGTTWYYVRVAEDRIAYVNKGADYWETTLNFYEQLT